MRDDKPKPRQLAAQMSPDDWAALRYEAVQLFSPSAPIAERSLFAGRIEEISRILDAVHERGKHVLLFGEQGVGKTSLVNVLEWLFPPTLRRIRKYRIQADPADTFASLWRKAFREIDDDLRREGGPNVQLLLEQYDGGIGPDDVRREFQAIFHAINIPVVIFDEFDKIDNKDAVLSLMANTIKALSDYSVGATIMIVGVADDVNGLIGEHTSIGRCAEQVLMSRMSIEERQEILAKTIPRLGMVLEPDARYKIVYLSRGLPAYVHALGRYAVEAAIDRKSLGISEADVDNAMRRVLQMAQESIRNAYLMATESNRSDSLYREVLLACALAETDERGMFTPKSICKPLTGILKRSHEVEIAAFQQHLRKFIDDDRGCILDQKGRERQFRYRFRDPMMQPYVIMRGIEQGFIGMGSLKILSFPEQPDLPIGE